MPNESLLATHLFMFTGFMRVRWCSGMRFKMAFETEDSSRISWFMGTIASEQSISPPTYHVGSCIFCLVSFVKILESEVSRFWLFSFG
ncbi:unnamed protein product [Prunus brigantina]